MSKSDNQIWWAPLKISWNIFRNHEIKIITCCFSLLYYLGGRNSDPVRYKIKAKSMKPGCGIRNHSHILKKKRDKRHATKAELTSSEARVRSSHSHGKTNDKPHQQWHYSPLLTTLTHWIEFNCTLSYQQSSLLYIIDSVVFWKWMLIQKKQVLV